MSTTWSSRPLALVPTSRWTRAILVGLATAAAIASSVAGGLGALAATTLAGIIVFAIAAALADSAHRDSVVALAIGLLLARIVIAVGLHLVLQQQNEGGAMFEDDFGYVRIGAILARMWHGETVLSREMPLHFDPSTVHTYSRAVGGLFYVFGPNVAVAKIANTALVLTAALFFYRTTLLVAGRSAALLALSGLVLWPSLALWTSLTLKEAMALFCAGGAAWAVTEMIRRPHAGWFVAMIGFTLPLQDARPYLHAILLGLWPVSLLVVRVFTGRPRLVWSVAAALVAAVAISSVRLGLAVTPAAIRNAEDVRTGMAEGAQSAIIEATRQFQAAPGSCYVVRIPGSREVGRSPQVHRVAPNTTLVYADRATTDIKPPQGGVKVRDGDILCVKDANPAVSMTPVEGPVTSVEGPVTAVEGPVTSVEVFVTTTGSTRLSQDADAGMAPAGDDIIRNLSYLPQGAVYLLGAPLPWDIAPYPGRWPLIPEMAIWYAVVALALAGLVVVVRERRWNALYVVLVGLAVAGVLSLVEGNLGTLVRHRGMLIPYAIVLASLVAARWAPLQKLAR